jgi:hypothetical protein
MDDGDKQCKECGSGFETLRGKQRFCTADCRRRYHNRRLTRGSKIYDLLMMYCFDRQGEGPEAHKLICRFASDFREQDKAAGRGQSWLTLTELKEDGLLAVVSATRGWT